MGELLLAFCIVFCFRSFFYAFEGTDDKKAYKPKSIYYDDNGKAVAYKLADN